MIPILFSASATTFATNGIGRLSDAISCVVHEARNGEFELEMEYPVDGAHYSDIVHSAIIVAKPSARRNSQAFRIYKISRPMRGTVTVYAQHISYQLSWIPVSPFTATNLTNALAYLSSMSAEANPFTFSADFTSDADFAIPIPSSIRSYFGGREGSFLDIYGGEWEFDNYNVTLHSARGTNSGYTIQYGKNLTDLTQEESILETYTGIFPYWQSEEEMVTLDTKVVHADTASNFPFQRTLVMDFSEAFEDKPTQAQLITYTRNYINANDIGIPAVSLKIDFVNLPDTEEYKSLLVGSQNLDLCDTVTVIFSKLGISTTAKVVDIKWNVLKNRYDSIEVGNSRSTLSDTIEQTITVADAAVTSSQMSAKIDRATGVLNAGTRGHVVLNRNAGGWANELLALDNDNIASAQKVLRINMNGIGFSSDGYDGPYYNSWTMDGTLSLGGSNNSYGNLRILDNSGNVIGYWTKDGISITKGTISIGGKFSVDANGNMVATNGTFNGDITAGSDITGADITGSTFRSSGGEFFVNEDPDTHDIECGFTGFFFDNSVMRTAWSGNGSNPVTGDGCAGIRSDGDSDNDDYNGMAAFQDVYIMSGSYFVDERLDHFNQLLSDLDDRVTTLEQANDNGSS